eukprot:Rmarinus@m.16563
MGMLVPKKNRVAVYKKLFEDGVLCAKKDYVAPKHHEIESVPNLQVCKIMQSLKSRGYVKENFAWMWYYWFLTNEGIEYLREYLHLPDDVVPNTLQKRAPQPRPSGMRDDRPPRDRFGDRGFGGDRGFDKKVGPGANFEPEYRSGGRGEGGFGGFGGGRGRGFGRGAPRGDFGGFSS